MRGSRIWAPSPDKNFERFQKSLYKDFCRHLVCFTVYITYLKNSQSSGKTGEITCTGFIIEIGGVWIIATAGHFLRDLETNVENKIYRVDDATIADFFGPKTIIAHPKRFPIMEERKCHCVKDRMGLDVGFVFPSDPFQKSLKKSGLVSIKQEHWKEQPKFYSNFHVVGFPASITAQLGARGKKVFAPVMASLQPVSAASDLPLKGREQSSGYPWFFGRLMEKVTFDIGGMSGSPIFGIRRNPKKPNSLLYWIVAMHSGWYPPPYRIIRACPVSYFAEILVECIRKVNPGMS